MKQPNVSELWLEDSHCLGPKSILTFLYTIKLIHFRDGRLDFPILESLRGFTCTVDCLSLRAIIEAQRLPAQFMPQR